MRTRWIVLGALLMIGAVELGLVGVNAAGLGAGKHDSPTMPPAVSERSAAAVPRAGGQALSTGGRALPSSQSDSPPESPPVSPPVSPPPTTTFEYDQTDNPSGNGTSSQNFETANDAYDDQAADDFVVPPSDGAWRIQTIEIPGGYSSGGGPLASVNVWIYGNAGSLPGGLVFSQLGLVPTSDAGGDLVLDLPSPPTLLSGTYWLSVQANMDYSAGGQWFWDTRAVQSNSPFAWQNPGNGFGSGCMTWGTGVTCVASAPDLLFRLRGTKGVSSTDSDGDGCTKDKEEYPGLAAYNPGATCAPGGPCYSDSLWYDFYNVPVPANPDPIANGPKNQSVNMSDVLAVLFYVGTRNNDVPNGNGVDYDSLKDGDWFDGARQVAIPDGVVDDWDKVGRRYDRSLSPSPNPPWEAGPPSGTVAMNDVLLALAQVGLTCRIP